VPSEALGAGLDGHQQGDLDKTYTPEAVAALSSIPFHRLSYRLRTELGVAVWHWNEEGAWSDLSNAQGYWISSDRADKPIQATNGYKLPRRGNTHDHPPRKLRAIGGRARLPVRKRRLGRHTGRSGAHVPGLSASLAICGRRSAAAISASSPSNGIPSTSAARPLPPPSSRSIPNFSAKPCSACGTTACLTAFRGSSPNSATLRSPGSESGLAHCASATQKARITAKSPVQRSVGCPLPSSGGSSSLRLRASIASSAGGSDANCLRAAAAVSCALAVSFNTA
jgi:hypothetical protein